MYRSDVTLFTGPLRNAADERRGPVRSDAAFGADGHGARTREAQAGEPWHRILRVTRSGTAVLMVCSVLVRDTSYIV